MDNLDFALALGCLLGGTFLYQFDPHLEKFTRYLLHHPGRDWLAWDVYLQRWKGLIYLGVIPAIIMLLFASQNFALYGLFASATNLIWITLIVLSAIVLVFNCWHAAKDANLQIYPQIRRPQWSITVVFGSAITWFLYLLAYEFLFRGILLFSSLQVLDTFTAIMLNVSLYSLFHFTKGWKESLASIPFGILLCMFTLKSGSLWPAIILHTTLALSNEWLSIYFHPDMTFKRIL